MYGESEVTTALELLLESSLIPLRQDVLDLLKHQKPLQDVTVFQPNLEDYDALYANVRGVG